MMTNKMDRLAKKVRKSSKTDIGYVGKLTGGSAALGTVLGGIRLLMNHGQLNPQEISDELLASAGTVGVIGLLYSLACWQIWKVREK